MNSHIYNIDDYELAKLIGLDDKLTVTVWRKRRGKTESLIRWIPTLMTIGEKEAKKISPPDLKAWNNFMY